MHDSRLLHLLEALLSEAELYGMTRRQLQNDIRRFVVSPYFIHEKDKHVVALFDYIVQYLPKFDHHDLERKKVMHALFPDQTINEKTYTDLRRNMADLSDLIEKYIIYRQVNSKSIIHNQALLDFYNRNKIDNEARFQHLITESQQLNDQQNRSQSYYYTNYLISTEKAKYNSFKPFDEAHYVAELQQSLLDLESHYLIAKLRLYCHLLSLRQTTSAGSELIVSSEWIQFIQHSNYLSIPAVKTYYHAFMLLYDQAKELHFPILKQLLTDNTAIFDAIEIRNFYIHAENFCAIQILSGNNEYRKALFALYAEQLERGMLYHNNTLDIRKFKNIVTLGVWLQEFDFTKKFIDENHELVRDQYHDEVYHYCLAYWYFGQKNYDKVTEHLNLAQQQKRFYNIAYRTDSHKLQIKTYYECGEEQLLSAKLNTFTAFVRNNEQMAANSQRANNNFVKIVKKLFAIKTLPQLFGYEKTNEQKKQKLLNEVAEVLQKEALIAERPWVVDQLQQLQKKLPNQT